MASGAPAPGGIMPRTYKSGSIIYFENDKSEYIYILKSGRVMLTSIKLDSGEEVKEDVKQGEFFGVKSALGKYPREETAQTIGETIVLVLTLADFERLILRNANVVRKMLRVFSNQLRRTVKMERSILGEGDSINPEVELYRIGEYYFKAGDFQKAQYAFKRYMEYYPDTKYSGLAMEKIKTISSGQAIPGDSFMDDEIESPSAEPAEEFDDFDLNDRSDDMDSFDDSASADSSLSSEMDDFLSDDESVDDLDDFTFDISDSGADTSSYILDLYNNATELFEQNEFSHALELYEKIISSDDFNGEEEEKVYEKAYFEIGCCQIKLGKHRDALDTFASVAKNFPNSESAKNALLHIGIIFETAKKNDKALQYYKKAASLPPNDSISKDASDRIKQLQTR